ncbi:MAG TPA: hypothetical protein VMP11_10835 [Verrucomicrobiae bacterium]|nr:hypothetical protein [Verrucomicrobiae bacterium]
MSTNVWEASLPEGWYEGYKDMVEERTSKRNGLPYWLFVFRVEHNGVSGRFAFYCGHHRAEEAKALKLALAINPFARVRIAKKDGVAGMVVAEVKTKEARVQ